MLYMSHSMSKIFVQVSQVCYVFYPHEVACHFLFLGLSLALPTAKRAKWTLLTVSIESQNSSIFMGNFHQGIDDQSPNFKNSPDACNNNSILCWKNSNIMYVCRRYILVPFRWVLVYVMNLSGKRSVVLLCMEFSCCLLAQWSEHCLFSSTVIKSYDPKVLYWNDWLLLNRSLCVLLMFVRMKVMGAV